MEQDKKRAYIAPEIKVTLLELEETIATGSATAKPVGAAGTVQQEWETGPNDDRTFTWS